MLEIIVCKVCGEEKERSKYIKSICNDCYKDYKNKRMREYRKKNYEKLKPKYALYTKRFKENHPEKFKSEECKQRRKEIRMNSYNKDSETYSPYLSHRIWRAFGSGTKSMVALWKEMCLFYGNKCLCCQKPGDYISLEPDHIIPRSKGGIDSIDNIQPLCHICNNVKRIKNIDYRTKIFVPANIPT
jgi:5-methylcytosine-specific restriction endonuclease McrA